MSKQIIKLFVVLVCICSIGSILAFKARAETMTNDSYKLQKVNLDSRPGQEGNSETKLTSTSAQSESKYSGTNYTVYAGFKYLKSSLSPFSFSITTTSINFGKLIPGEPITRTNTLTVSSPSSYGYQVLASETHPLRLRSGQALRGKNNLEIQDTTCDAGNCSQVTPGAWTSPLTYGFGYRCDNIGTSANCSHDFADLTYYKQFSDNEKPEDAEAVMVGFRAEEVGISRITYKVNIPGTQAAGTYQNNIIYIAIPSI